MCSPWPLRRGYSQITLAIVCDIGAPNLDLLIVMSQDMIVDELGAEQRPGEEGLSEITLDGRPTLTWCKWFRSHLGRGPRRVH